MGASTCWSTQGRPKVVQDNTGGKTIKCKGNGDPFVSALNPGWQSYEDQCSAGGKPDPLTDK